MKKFVYKLLASVVAMGGIIVGMHVVRVLQLQREVNEVYSLKPEQDVLVLSSSELGCGISDDVRFHNKKIWVSDTSVVSQLMRLRELERREQLKHVKTLILPFNFTILLAQTESGEQWAWYQELPISWREMDALPCGKLSMLWYMVTNLRWPFNIYVSANPPKRNALSERPEKWKADFMRTQCRPVSEGFTDSLLPGWDNRLQKTYERVAEICKRHGIRFVVVQAPLLPQYRNVQQHLVMNLEKEWIGRIRAIGAEYCVVDVTLDDKYFFDTRHLIDSGAKTFSEALYKTLNFTIMD